jgi:hypothetical protein
MRGEKTKVGYGVTPSGRVISVRPLMRPEPDARLLAKVFLYMAKRDIEENAKNDRAA